jgi:hypothetical protein
MGVFSRMWAWLRRSPVAQLKQPGNWSTWQGEARTENPPSETGKNAPAREPRD